MTTFGAQRRGGGEAADAVWRDEAGRRENGNKCKHSTCAVLNALSADARRALNRTVAYARKVYAAAVAVHDRRCAERLRCPRFDSCCSRAHARGL